MKVEMEALQAELEAGRARVADLEARLAEMEARLAAKEKVIDEQIKLVGSRKIFDRMEANFKDQRLDTLLMVEQMALYSWRKEFFLTCLPAGTWVTECNTQAAVHYNITENFDYLLDLVVTEEELLGTSLPTEYFTDYIHTSYSLPEVLTREGEEAVVEHLAKLDFSQAVHALCALHAAAPPHPAGSWPSAGWWRRACPLWDCPG